MKIVLRQDVPKLGEAGSVRDVADGYARNYLIPRGLAVVATPGELKTAANNQQVQARKIAREEEKLQSLADRIAGQRLEFTARAGEQGRLYGSITAADVAEKLSAAVGEEIDRRKVALEEPIRTVGEHRVTVNLVGRLKPQVTVVVVGETPTTGEPAGEEHRGVGHASKAGHPTPGSGHNDSKTETVAEGPDVGRTDGVPGAFGNPGVTSPAEIESNEEGPAAEVIQDLNS